MIPLVGLVKELKDQKTIVDRVAKDVMKEQGVKFKYLVGTMIEVPRGAVTADQIATEAQFFSFGTNDLTQLTFGFSRDDAGKFLGAYQERKILERDPFQSIDTVGVGSARGDGVREGPQGPAGHQARHLRRARRRPVVGALLPQGGAQLRERLAVPRPGRPSGGGARGDVGQGGRLVGRARRLAEGSRLPEGSLLAGARASAEVDSLAASAPPREVSVPLQSRDALAKQTA